MKKKSINQSNNLEMDKKSNKLINFQQMVLSYFLSNMNSPHDLCLVGTKNIFFCQAKIITSSSVNNHLYM